MSDRNAVEMRIGKRRELVGKRISGEILSTLILPDGQRLLIG
jgi:hypothetical protein